MLDDDQCLDLLWRRRLSADGKRAWCSTCRAERRFRRLAGRPSFRCSTCGHDVHPAAGTIFERSSTPLRLWFRAVSLLAAGDVTARQLERELGVNYKTALRIAGLVRAGLADPNSDVAAIAAMSATNGEGRLAVARRAVWAPGTISSLAGDGAPGYGGDGGPAAAAQLNAPFGVTVDHRGDVLIADSGNHVVRSVDASGRIWTIAGTGAAGYSGDGGPARSAQLNDPQHVSVDESGNIFICDCANHAVRKIDRQGRITTVAGTGAAGFSGDGGAAVGAELRGPSQTLPVGSSLLVSDYGNGRLRRVDAAGTITTVAGNGAQSTSGDGGPAIEASMYRPCGLAVDSAGDIYVTQLGELDDARVRRIDSAGTITSVARGLRRPVDILIDASGNVFIAELARHVVRRVGASGTISTIAGAGRAGFSGNGAPAIEAELNQPIGIAATPDGDLLIADSQNHRIRVVTGALG